MIEINRLKEWRSVEIVKIFLLRLNQELIIEYSPTDQFDLIISLAEDPGIRFGIEVKSKKRFTSKVNKQIEQLSKNRDQKLITTPVLIIKVDDIQEEAEFDFLVYPSFQKEKLLVRYVFQFASLNKKNFTTKLEIIKKWYTKIAEETPEKEKELNRRSVSDSDLSEMARADIKNSYIGKAVVGYIQIPQIQNRIIQDIDEHHYSEIESLIKIRKFVAFCINNVQTIKMLDYDENTLIEEIEYPRAISYSDYFIFILPIDESSNQRKLASIFSVISMTLELMNVSLANGYAIRGAIDFDDVYYNHNDLTLVGKALDNSVQLTLNFTNDYRVILSDHIKSLIRDSIANVNASIVDYYRRFLFKDEDGWITINPALILANTRQKAEISLKKLSHIISYQKTDEEKMKFNVIINKIRTQDLELKDISIFD